MLSVICLKNEVIWSQPLSKVYLQVKSSLSLQLWNHDSIIDVVNCLWKNEGYLPICLFFWLCIITYQPLESHSPPRAVNLLIGFWLLYFLGQLIDSYHFSPLCCLQKDLCTANSLLSSFCQKGEFSSVFSNIDTI